MSSDHEENPVSAAPEIRVVERPDLGDFEILVDEQHAGMTRYRPQDDARAFPHTEVEEEFRGQGLSQQLIRSALDQTRATGLAVLPFCSAVRDFIAEHEDYLDLVPVERRAEFDLEG